jgi:hypothetical protein
MAVRYLILYNTGTKDTRLKEIFAMAVIKMVKGIRNSTSSGLIFIISRDARARVTEWPIVNAVTRITTCFQSENK